MGAEELACSPWCGGSRQEPAYDLPPLPYELGPIAQEAIFRDAG